MEMFGIRLVGVKPAVRLMTLVVAGASKAIFIALVLSQGGRFLGRQAGIAAAVDLMWVVVFAAYLIAVRRTPVAHRRVRTPMGAT